MNDEVICGYLVTAEQKKKNAVYLDLLAEFGRLCEKAGIQWWMHFGNLIGAVRHKGFIPWDDDIDLALPRQDFDRLAAMTNEEFGAEEPYFLQNPVTDPGYVEALLRFRRSDTTYIVPWNWRETKAQADDCPYNMGMCLALFPVDNVPKHPAMRRLQSAAVGSINSLMYRAYAPRGERPVRRFVGRCFAAVLGRDGFSRFSSLPYRLVRKNRSGKLQTLGGRLPENTYYDEADFAGTLMVPFEDLMVPIPVGYDDILRTSYGEYMEFPPVEKRCPPHEGIMDPETPYRETVRRLRAGELSFPEDGNT
ncbi:MAG: phosphorylcholine transferase LicD [Oscillospiraceae bacterium]